MTEELNIETVSIAQFTKELKEVSDKYNTYIRDSDNIKTIRARFEQHYREMHNNIDIDRLNCGSVHPSKFTENADTYADLVSSLAPFVDDTANMRLLQVMSKFIIGEIHFKTLSQVNNRNSSGLYALAKSDYTNEQILKELDRTSAKKIVLRRFGLDDKYRNRDIMQDVIELFKLALDIDVSYDVWDCDTLEGHQNILNSLTDRATVKYHINGNIYISLKDAADRDKLLKVISDDLVKSLNRSREY